MPETSSLIRLEHANFPCRSLSVTLKFLQNIFPDWHVRIEGINHEGNKWMHVGSDQFYMSITENPKRFEGASQDGNGIIHVGFVLRDGAAMLERLKKHNIQFGMVPAPECKYRIYVFDPEGREIFELIEYNPDYALK